MTKQKVESHKGEGHRKRLREKFLKSGLKGFNDYEVIELLLSLNTPRKDCKQAAKDLLKKFKTFQSVLDQNTESLCEIKDVGKINSMGIRLIKDVADRYLKANLISKNIIQNPDDLINYWKHSIANKSHEVFACVFLNAKNEVLSSKILFKGTLTTSAVYPREVVKESIENNAASVVFAHNHPSGNTNPSDSDIQITKKLFFALNYAGIQLHDHMIIGANESYSFAEYGLISKFEKEFKKQNG